jgi:Tfp pilus assembly protein PilO
MGQEVKDIVLMLLKNRVVQVLVFLIVAAAVLNAGFYTLRTSREAVRAESLATRLEDMRKDILAMENERRLYANYGTGREKLAIFKQKLPKRTDYIDILNKLYRLAKSDGMMTSSLSTVTRQAGKEGDILLISFSIPVSGDYRSVRKYIYDIETSPLFLTIDSLSLSADQATGSISLSIGISTYARSG